MNMNAYTDTCVDPAASDVIGRIRTGLNAAPKALSAFTPRCLRVEEKHGGGGPITDADRLVSEVLYETLVREGEGWLSEESVDGLERLTKARVWIVDPIYGTRELVAA